MSADRDNYKKRVEEYDLLDPAFDQETYEVRINAEADLMVSLEALKIDVTEIEADIQNTYQQFQIETQDIDDNFKALEEIYNQNRGQSDQIQYSKLRVADLDEECIQAQFALHDIREAIILYCQQFAAQPEMVKPC